MCVDCQPCSSIVGLNTRTLACPARACARNSSATARRRTGRPARGRRGPRGRPGRSSARRTPRARRARRRRPCRARASGLRRVGVSDAAPRRAHRGLLGRVSGNRVLSLGCGGARTFRGTVALLSCKTPAVATPAACLEAAQDGYCVNGIYRISCWPDDDTRAGERSGNGQETRPSARRAAPQVSAWPR